MTWKFGQQVEMFPTENNELLEKASNIPTEHKVIEQLVIARDEVRTLFYNIVSVKNLHEDNEDSVNPFLHSQLDSNTTSILHDSLSIIYSCLDVAIRGVKKMEV